MSDWQISKIILHGTIPGGRKKGRPRKSWNEVVQKDIDTLKIRTYWSIVCMHRPTWRELISKAVPDPFGLEDDE